MRGPEPPQWSGPRDLLAIEDGKLLTIHVGKLPRALDLGGSRPIAVADLPHEFRGEPFPDPFRNAPRLRPGESAWLGRLVVFDPIVGRVDAAIEAEVSANGTTLNLSRPASRSAEVTDPKLARRLALAPETELRLTLSEGKVVGVYIPTFGEAASSRPATGRLLRPPLTVEYDGITREVVVVPIVYPIPGPHTFVDTFLDARGGGARRHHGNDLMAPKMTPLLALFDGVVSFARTSAPGASNSLTLRSDDGWTATYLHINNDTPGTDDGLGSLRYAFPADLQSGDRVRAGEVVAWCGDSGNAEDAGSHLHLELYDGDARAIIDPAPSLRAARRLERPIYSDPDPSLEAAGGEERWEGVAVSLDMAKRVAIVELTGLAAPGEACRRNLKPRLVYLDVPSGLTLGYRGAGNGLGSVAYPLTVLRPGLRVGAVGAVTGAKMRVRRATIALGGQ